MKKTTSIFAAFALFFMIPLAVFAVSLPQTQTMDELFKDFDGAFVLSALNSDELDFYHKSRCQKRLTPCSTFKIANTLCALENNIVQNENTILKWDLHTYPIRAWNQDLSLAHAMSVSAVPHFQELAKKAGKKRMQDFVNSIDYGNKDISGGITTFWLGSSLEISAVEQVGFLKKMLLGKLPVSKRSVEIVKNCMLTRTTEKGEIFGKTGTRGTGASFTDTNLGWFVGFVENKQQGTFVFAVNITGGQNPSGTKAKNIANAVLAQMGLI